MKFWDGTFQGAGGNWSTDLLVVAGSSEAGFGANIDAVGLMKSSGELEDSVGLGGYRITVVRIVWDNSMYRSQCS